MLSVNELALEIFDNLADLAEEFNAGTMNWIAAHASSIVV